MFQKRLPKWRQHFGQKWLTIFCQKAQKFCIVRTFVVQILIKWCKERLWTSNVSISNDNIKCPIGKSIFCSNFAIKTFRATVANADLGSLKFLHTFLKNVCTTCLWNMNQIIWFKLHETWSFLTKNRFFTTTFEKELTPFWKTFL